MKDLEVKDIISVLRNLGNNRHIAVTRETSKVHQILLN